MPEGQVLEFTHVTKRFNEVTAVSDFSARVEPGAVTAFLGPNGAGKTTTLRILLGQVRATSGTATIGGTAYAELRQPLRTIGAVLEETVYRPRRTAERQLTIAAKANGIPLARVGEVLSLVGLESEGDSRIGGFSLGMRQRLSVAHALLGDPGALVFDEPANGLDPEGIRWMRLLMRRLADEGRTVLVSSHVLSEVEQVADNVLVLSKGKLVLASGIETLADPQGGSVIVDAADRDALTAALTAAGFDIEVLRSGLTVRGGDAGTVGAVAADAGIALSTLVQRGPTLEDVFIDLMRGGRLASRADGSPSASSAEAPVAVAAAGVAAASLADDEATTTSDPTEEPVRGDGADDLPLEAAPVLAAADDGFEAGATDAEASVAAGEADDSAVEEPAADEAPSEEDAPSEETASEGAETEDAPTEQTATEVLASESDDSGNATTGSEDTGSDPDGTESEGTDAAGTGSDEDAPARSFDEILFGTAAPVAAAPSAHRDEPRHDVAGVFEPTDDDTVDAATETPTEDAVDGEPTDGEPTGGEGADEDGAADEDHAGVEIFAELGESSDTPEGNDTAADDDHGDEQSGEEASDEDPRSAAVSSMLAAAARAYYVDEPKDYPLTDASSSEEGAHWSVASTGVIDTVPLAASDEGASSEPAPSADETGSGESASDEAGSEETGSDEGESSDNASEITDDAQDAPADEHHTDEDHTDGDHTDEHHEHRGS